MDLKFLEGKEITAHTGSISFQGNVKEVENAGIWLTVHTKIKRSQGSTSWAGCEKLIWLPLLTTVIELDLD